MGKIQYKTMRHEDQKTFGEFEMDKEKKVDKCYICTKHLLVGKGKCPYCEEKKPKVDGGF